MRRHHRDLEIMSEMNLTNMLDTAFILLISFMLIAPMIKHGIELNLPKVSRENLKTTDRTLTIVIKKRPMETMADPLYIDEKRVTLEELTQAVIELREKFPGMAVVIEGDLASSYGTLAKVLGALMNNGIENVGLVTEPEDLEGR
jgi:biopolymer transport protein TolR